MLNVEERGVNHLQRLITQKFVHVINIHCYRLFKSKNQISLYTNKVDGQTDLSAHTEGVRHFLYRTVFRIGILLIITLFLIVK